MRVNVFWCLVVGCLPSLLEGREPVARVEDLLKPSVLLENFAVTAPPFIGHSTSTGGKLQLSGELKDEACTIILRPEEGHWDISGYSYFRVDVTNNGDGLVWIRGRLDNAEAHDWRNSSSSMAYLLPGERATLGFPFQRPDSADDSPEMFRLQDSRPNGFRHHWIPFNPEDVIACRLVIRSASGRLNLGDIQLGLAQPYGAKANARLLELPYLDKYGQVRQLEWPGKLRSGDELAGRVAEEARESEGDAGPASFNRFGGWNAGPQLEATGYFRLEKYKGRWWFVDPEGGLFFSHGANSVGFAQPTPLKNRQELFEWMPSETDLGDAITGKDIHFTIANLHRTYGPDWKTQAYERIHRRMRRWGMNTVGAWSDKDLYQNPRTPYTAILHVGHGHSPLGNKVPDPFSGDFERSVREGLRKLPGPSGADPWCIGVFIDNELGWDEDFVHKALAGDAHMPARKAVFAFLEEKYATIEKLNAAWLTSYDSWEALDKFPEKSEAFEQDLKSLKRLIASRYYKVCHDMMRMVLPHHLYLGSRIHTASAEIMEEAIRYADVLSINRYMPLASTMIPPNLDKPCLISEFHFGAPDRGVPGAGLVHVGDQLQRSRAYAAYVLDAVLHPNVVGAHWFAYADQSAAGRSSAGLSGENYQIGFVDVTDTPYPEITTSSRGLADLMYSLADRESVDLLQLLEDTWSSQRASATLR